MQARDRMAEEIALLSLFLISTATNCLALLVFCRRPGLRTVSNRFVINLLATNLLTTCLLVPVIFGEHSASVHVELWIEIGDSAAVACSLLALLSITLIAVDQHHAVTDPLRCHTRVLKRRPASLCAASWSIAAAAAFVQATMSILHYRYPSEPAVQAIELAYSLAYLVFGVCTPIAVVCVMYARIYKAARSSGMRARAQGASALQLHEPQGAAEVAEENDGITLKIDMKEDSADVSRKFGPFLLPPDKPERCPSVSSLRNAQKNTNVIRSGLPAVNSAPSLAIPLLAAQPKTQISTNESKITSIRCRISNASLFKYREESRAARVGLLTAVVVMLHLPHAIARVLDAIAPSSVTDFRGPVFSLLLLSSALSSFLFALRSRRVQREARRLLMPKKSAWERASAAAADGNRSRAALDLLRTLTPEDAEASRQQNTEVGVGRSSFSSGGSTQMSSASDE